jgi:hypothetical protein
MFKKIKTSKNPDENLDLPVDFENMMIKIFLIKRLRLLSIVCEKPKRNPRFHKKIRLQSLG